LQHLLAQLPQLLKSVIRSTHVPLQFVIPLGQPQVPPEHVPALGHAWPQAPQLLAFVWVLTQAPLHTSGAAPGHAHWPPTQLPPVGQLCPHVPQSVALVVRLTQAPLQTSGASPGQVHCEPVQVAFVGQACPQVPQLPLSMVVSTQPPLQSVVGVGQLAAH
jgi:hypothetical protein